MRACVCWTLRIDCNNTVIIYHTPGKTRLLKEETITSDRAGKSGNCLIFAAKRYASFGSNKDDATLIANTRKRQNLIACKATAIHTSAVNCRMAEHTQRTLFMGNELEAVVRAAEVAVSANLVTLSSTGIVRHKGCAECGTSPAMMCAKCGMTRACGAACWAKQWSAHRTYCKRLSTIAKCRQPFFTHLQFFACLHDSKQVAVETTASACVIKFACPRLFRSLGDWLAGTRLDSATYDISTHKFTMTRGQHVFEFDWKVESKSSEMKRSLGTYMARFGVKECTGAWSTITRARLDDFVCDNQACMIMVDAVLSRDQAEYQAGDKVAFIVTKSNGWMRIVGNKGTALFKSCDGFPAVTLVGPNSGEGLVKLHAHLGPQVPP